MMRGMSYTTTLRIPAPRFDWHRLVFAHGWIHLTPFNYDEKTRVLSRPLRLHSFGSVNVSIAPPSKDQLTATIEHGVPLEAEDKPFIRAQIERMLRLTEDF